VSEQKTRASHFAADRASRGDTGALYVHLQSGTGVEHRTIVLAPRHVRLLRTLWSPWGATLIVAILASWVYFAIESSRVPFLTRRVSDLEAEGVRVDTLRAKLQSLQRQYDQVQRMLGLPAMGSVDSATVPKPRAR
jgi:hypothetical protein